MTKAIAHPSELPPNSSSRSASAPDIHLANVTRAPKRRYLKAHFSPEEWAERCRKNRERARKRAAALTPEERAERNAYFAEAHRRHYAKRRDDPEGRAQLKTTSREKRERIRSDPGRHAMYLERKRAAYRRRRELAKLFTATKSATPATSDGLATMRAKALTIPAFDQIIKSMPAKWSMDFKEEIAAEAMILLLDRTTMSVAEAVKLGLKTHNRLYNRFKTVSIDAENADGLRMIDTIATDHMANYL